MRSERLGPGALCNRHRLVVFMFVLALVGACSGSAATPSSPGVRSPAPVPTATHHATQPVVPTTRPTARATPAATPTGAPAHWEPAGTMRMAHIAPQLFELSDGRVLAVGNSITDTYRGGRPDASTRIVEVWNPATNAWKRTDSLNKPRDWFSSATLEGGRPLVIGGINDEMASYSSTYLFDPSSDTWVKSGLLGTARFDASVETLADGRVLAVGGRYSSGSTDYGTSTSGIVLAVASTHADVDPGPPGHLLALAEIYDPATGAWSPTGSMRWARAAASTARLGDGRVLVVGGREPYEDEADTAEAFDPATGRFSTLPLVPTPSETLLQSLGIAASESPWSRMWFVPESLVPWPNGDAVLLGVSWWRGGDGGDITLTASVRFDASADDWVVEADSVHAVRRNSETEKVLQEWGTERPTEVTAVLRDGRLVFVDWEGGRRVDVYDPGTGRWSRLPSVPVRMPSPAAIQLSDGSLLLVPSEGGTKAYRFVF